MLFWTVNLITWLFGFVLREFIHDATNNIKDSLDTSCMYHLSEHRHTVGIPSIPVTAFDDGATRF